MTDSGPGIRLTAIADLHMAAGADDAFGADDELVRFLDALAEERGEGARLAVLGDLFDFSLVELPGDPHSRLATDAAAALAKLELIAAAHERAVDGLRRFLVGGGTIDLVPGNHDLELLLPPVWGRVEELLLAEGGAPGALRLHPWVLFVPGLLYAEHGHQHHDLNRVAGLLGVPGREAAPLPAGTLAAEWVRQLRSRPGPAAVLAGRAVPDALRWTRSVRQGRAAREAHAAQMRRHASELALPPAALLAIDAIGPHGPLRTAARAARRLAGERRGRRQRPGGYMHAGIAAVDRALAAHGVRVPYYATGHTHFPADVPVGSSSPPARYLNPGTWSRLRPDGAGGLSYLQLERGPGGHSAALRRWTA